MPDFNARAATLVNATTAGDQTAPAVAALAGGGWAVAWWSSADQAVHAQQFDAAGNRVAGELLVGAAPGGTVDGVAAVPGGFVVMYTSGGVGGPSSVLAQRLDLSGHLLGGAIVVASSSDGSIPVSGDGIEAYADGGWLATWHSEYMPPSPQENGQLFAQRFDASGIACGAPVTVSAETGTLGGDAAVRADGQWLVAFSSFLNFHDGIEAFTKEYSAGGAPQGGFTIDPNPAANEVNPQVAVLAGGQEVVAWFVPDNQPTWFHLQAQLFDAAGAPAGPAFDLANADGVLAGSAPQVTALADGGFLVSWEHIALVSASTTGPSTYAFEIRGQYFDAAGHATGAALPLGPTVTMQATSPPSLHWSVAATADGGFVVTRDEHNGTSGLDVLVQKFAPAPVVQAGTAADDVFAVGTGSTHIDGGAGVDTAVFDASVGAVQGFAVQGGVISLTTAQGTQTLASVERVRFSDALFAFDTQAASGQDPGGHVWQSAAVLHAVFGAMPGRAELSHWTAVADRAGSMAAMAQDLIDTYAPGVSSSTLVTYLYQQLVHEAPSPQTVQAIADQVGAGKAFATQGDLLAWAASLPVNTDALAGLVGSVQQLDPAWF